jgi:hypothetical protein
MGVSLPHLRNGRCTYTTVWGNSQVSNRKRENVHLKAWDFRRVNASRGIPTQIRWSPLAGTRVILLFVDAVIAMGGLWATRPSPAPHHGRLEAGTAFTPHRMVRTPSAVHPVTGQEWVLAAGAGGGGRGRVGAAFSGGRTWHTGEVGYEKRRTPPPTVPQPRSLSRLVLLPRAVCAPISSRKVAKSMRTTLGNSATRCSPGYGVRLWRMPCAALKMISSSALSVTGPADAWMR